MFGRVKNALDKYRGREVNYPASNRVQMSIGREYAVFSISNGLSKIQLMDTWRSEDIPSIQQGMRPEPQKTD